MFYDRFKVVNTSSLSDTAIDATAKDLNVSYVNVLAFALTESNGVGHEKNGVLKALFERHKFFEKVNGKYAESHPDICSSKMGGYKGGLKEYDRIERACALDENAALESTSWGFFQILGENYKICGYYSVNEMIEDFRQGADNQLKAFAKFCRFKKIDDDLRQGNVGNALRKYNGKRYKEMGYDRKYAENTFVAQQRFNKRHPETPIKKEDMPPVLVKAEPLPPVTQSKTIKTGTVVTVAGGAVPFVEPIVEQVKTIAEQTKTTIDDSGAPVASYVYAGLGFIILACGIFTIVNRLRDRKNQVR